MRLELFSLEERKIIFALAQYFYVTTGGEESVFGSRYTYVAVRPSHLLEHALPNAREFIVLFADYPNFEARTLQAYGKIADFFTDSIRINRYFRILVSRDAKIADKMKRIFAEDPDIPVTLPFTYNDFLSEDAGRKIVEATRENYYFRDLFSQRDPLRQGTFFFGRAELLAAMRDRMVSGANSGVFGLRKSGKTSILLACERLAKTDGHRFIHIDCQSASTTAARWNELLRAIAIDVRQAAGLAVTPVQLGEFTPTEAARSFEKALSDAYSLGKRRTVLAFDEVEHISPQTGIGHWRDSQDTLLFWQTMRSTHQRMASKMCFIVAGTNPTITETREMAGSDNPLLEYISTEYLPGFTDEETSQMCESLGGLMGMDFSVQAVAALYGSLGGHAFLTRQVASHIHHSLPFEGRPVRVEEEHVEAALVSFDFRPLFDDILSSLKARFPDEYQLLEWCALGEGDKVREFLELDPAFANHLTGYGLLRLGSGTLTPRMRLVADYLRSTARVSGVVRHAEDRWALIAKKRGVLERDLRGLVRGRLIDRFGRDRAAEELLQLLNKNRAEALSGCTLEQIFSPGECKLYFSDLISIIQKDHDYWARRLGIEARQLRTILIEVNDERVDAHAKTIDDGRFERLMGLIDSLQASL